MEDNLPKSPNKTLLALLRKSIELQLLYQKVRDENTKIWVRSKLIGWKNSWIDQIWPIVIQGKGIMSIWKFEGKSQYVQKQYSLWKLRDVLDIVNGNEIAGFQKDNLSFQDRFEKKLSFSKLYNFFKSYKQYIWNRDIPESSCLCKEC